ncbi:MAG: EF-Tu/IF-2/RF-3 family GTPase [Candidatus Altiarchaeota archaeon]
MAFRGNVTAVLGRDLGGQLGKKGTVSDVTLYNSKVGDAVLSFVEPSSYPDKVQSLLSSLNMADQALLRIDALDASLAESVVALDMVGVGKGYIVYGGSVNAGALKSLLEGTVAGSYEVLEDQSMVVKERLAQLECKNEGPAVVQVDHSFPVKGVGTVALGVVKQGVLKRHDNLLILPHKLKVSMKSLQVHDVDMEEAGTGLRVGVALKDIRPEDVPRGCILSVDGSVPVVRELEIDAVLSKYAPRPLGVGDQFSVNSCLNYVPAKVVSGSVEKGKTGRLKLSLEKETPILGGRVVFLDPGLKPPRVFGFGRL